MKFKDLNRRTFLSGITAIGTGFCLDSELFASAIQRTSPRPQRREPVRIRGVVWSAERPLPGVAISDGLNVVQTDGQGEFELVSDGRQPFVYLSIPKGYRIPTNSTGTARFYHPIRSNALREAEAQFELLPLDHSDENHRFFLLADPQTETLEETGLLHDETVPDVQQLVREHRSEEMFGFGCGDIMFDNLELFPEYERAVDRMDIPFFQVVGNHDLDQNSATDWNSIETFRRFFGPAYYSFDRGSVHYVVLDDVFWVGNGYIGYLEEQQLNWLRQDLALVEQGSTVVVVLHIPVLGTRFRRMGGRAPSLAGAVTNREALYSILEPFEAHILSGHTHESEHVFEGGAHEHIHGTVCGAWWSGPICYDGTPKGYGLYEVRGEEIRWQYKSTGYPLDHQMRVYSWGADPSAPDEVVANVWNCDPEWSVTWYEDGLYRGQMAQRMGFDPLSVEIHTGEKLPPKRPWVEPQPTEHLFYAPASRKAREIRVEATDRFGNTYSSVLSR